jgi:hypothetical protein
MADTFTARRAQIIETPARKPMRYYRKGGKIYDVGVEISAEEARATLRRHAESRRQNASNVNRAGDADLRSVMQKAQALANRKFDEEDAELRRALGEE